MEPKDILALAMDRASAVNTYWNIFIAIATAVVGIVASGKPFARSRALKIFLTLAFVVFAYSNLEAIIRLGELREALLEMLPGDLPNWRAVVASIRPAEWWRYTGFHVFLDLVVLSAIWFVPWHSAKTATES